MHRLLSCEHLVIHDNIYIPRSDKNAAPVIFVHLISKISFDFLLVTNPVLGTNKVEEVCYSCGMQASVLAFSVMGNLCSLVLLYSMFISQNSAQSRGVMLQILLNPVQ